MKSLPSKEDNNYRVLDLTGLSKQSSKANDPDSNIYYVCDVCQPNDIRLIEYKTHADSPHVGPYDKQYICPVCGAVRDTGLPQEIKRGETFKTVIPKGDNKNMKPQISSFNIFEEEERKDDYDILDFHNQEDENMLNQGFTNIESTIYSSAKGTFKKTFP